MSGSQGLDDRLSLIGPAGRKHNVGSGHLRQKKSGKGEEDRHADDEFHGNFSKLVCC